MVALIHKRDVIGFGQFLPDAAPIVAAAEEAVQDDDGSTSAGSAVEELDCGSHCAKKRGTI